VTHEDDHATVEAEGTIEKHDSGITITETVVAELPPRG
jgi:hypothetical protein